MMPRPPTPRQVVLPLSAITFAPGALPPQGTSSAVLTLDGLEALRLADLEGLYQEEAARRMGISRATFARVLAAARRQVADALINAKALTISGGVVNPASARRWPCPIHGDDKRLGRDCRCPPGDPPPSAIAAPPREQPFHAH